MKWNTENCVVTNASMNKETITGYKAGRFFVYKCTSASGINSYWVVSFMGNDTDGKIGPKFKYLTAAKNYAKVFFAIVGDVTTAKAVVADSEAREYYRAHGGAWDAKKVLSRKEAKN